MPASLLCQRCGEAFEAKRSDALWCPKCQIIKAKERQSLYETHKRDKCPKCGTSIVRRAKLCHLCDNKSRSQKYAGEHNPNWRNGWTRTRGYKYIRVKKPGEKGHPYQAEHRLVWQGEHGPLPKGWVVHHLNGIKDDNRPENLLALPKSEHHRHPYKAIQAYQERIRQLEAQLRESQLNPEIT